LGRHRFKKGNAKTGTGFDGFPTAPIQTRGYRFR
jgi:hypothetical protein